MTIYSQLKRAKESKSQSIKRVIMKKFNIFGLVVGTAIVGVSIGSSAVSAETFVLNGNKALNTNPSFRLIDGSPRMSTWEHSLSDPDQNFDPTFRS